MLSSSSSLLLLLSLFLSLASWTLGPLLQVFSLDNLLVNVLLVLVLFFLFSVVVAVLLVLVLMVLCSNGKE